MNPEHRLTMRVEVLSLIETISNAQALVSVQYPVLIVASSNGLAKNAYGAADIT